MKILALEFSSEQRSVAVVEGTDSRVLALGVDCTRQNSSLVLVENVLRESKVEREQIEVIAVGIGPGSYTGIRGAIALAQGWQLASAGKIKIIGVRSDACLARAAQQKKYFGKVCVLIDAQRKEFYASGFEISTDKIQEVEPLRLVGFEAAQSLARSGDIVVGPEVKKWFEAGRELFPDAGILGGMAVGRSDFVSGDVLEPVYLRETNFVKAPPSRVVL